MNQGQEEHRRRSEGWDRVPIKLLRRIGKRTMAEVLHVAATRLVWQRREYIFIYIWVGYDQGVLSQETGGSGGGCGGIFYNNSAPQHLNVCHRTAMAETQLPEHSGGSLACPSCVYPPALSSAIAGNQPAAAVELF